jgi:tetratricopeptide (TPR) repeat protein
MTGLVHVDPYEEGLRLSTQNRHAEAIDRFERALQTSPDDPRVLFALGNTARALGMSQPAQLFFNRVLALEPGRIEALVNLANLLRAEGNFGAAHALLAPALARNQDAPELWLTLGSVYREMGDSGLAEQYYRAALERRPDYPPALGNLADLLADQGSVNEALELYGTVLKREPKDAQARLNRSILQLLRGNLKDGWRDYAARLKIPGKAPVADHGLPSWPGMHAQTHETARHRRTGRRRPDHVCELDSRSRDAREGRRWHADLRMRAAACSSVFARSFPAVTVKPSRMQAKGGVTTAHYDWLKAAGGANAAIEAW